ncbi:MAG: isoleucine--tRNA ligase [Nanoarchaeota archaeon]|nr:isoleucine--tRNA ligase [Nanoarchaeota archaeon]
MLDFKKTESEILRFWEKNKIYEKVKKRNSRGKPFYFLQGPPYTSGKIHIGHAWNNSLKDIILRHKRMKGFNVWDRGGYDMHGLPTEHAVQKKLGLKTKEDIIEFGVDKFVKECMNFSIEHADYMNEDLRKLGVWMDHEGAYKPIEKEFIDGEWEFFKKAWVEKRLYKGNKVMHWDAETETSLAKHELEYKTIKDMSVFLKFKKKNNDTRELPKARSKLSHQREEVSGNEYFVIWTTTPWTIPFNLAIMVNPNLDYVKVKIDSDNKVLGFSRTKSSEGNEYWIIAKELAENLILGLLGKKLEIVDEFKGKELEGQEYVHIFHEDLKDIYDDLKKKYPKVHTIILSKEYVDTSAGTGLVHCAPGSGPEDQEVAKKYGIGPFNTLNEKGEFENLGKFNGFVARKDDYKFIEEFEKKGVLIKKTEVEHEYPHSDRSKNPVIFRTTEQWFLKTEDLVSNLLKFNKGVKWVPKKVGVNYDRWTENLRDNSVTRQRFWGTPIPIWICKCNNVEVIGNIKELEKKTGKKFDDLRLHKPWIDKIELKCFKCNAKMKRIPDVSDVWIDSGTVSWNCLYNDKKLIKKYFPADLILEATEQTRLWFSMLQICSAIMFNRSCYKNVFVHGMILDYQGMKMSKSLGNIISPYEVIDKYSADILRYYICQSSAGENINFNWNDIKVKQRNLIILTNITNYILDLEKQKLKDGKQEIEEKWILSRYNSTLKRVSELFDSYRIDETIGEIENLFMQLSRDYIKLVRDKTNENSVVLNVVKEVYLGILKIFSTICPFVTESLWQKMKQREKSIHLCSWPEFDNKKINSKLEKDFEVVMKIIESGLAERDKEKIGLRWPLQKAEISFPGKLKKDLIDIIKNQLNVKEVKLKSGKKILVKFDTKLTPELETEGFAREISRRVQAERKKRGLEKKDKIELKLLIGSKLKDRLKSYLEFIKKRTGSKSIGFVDGKIKGMIKFKVKDKDIGISF